jgi:hypothetical protein
MKRFSRLAIWIAICGVGLGLLLVSVIGVVNWSGKSEPVEDLSIVARRSAYHFRPPPSLPAMRDFRFKRPATPLN